MQTLHVLPHYSQPGGHARELRLLVDGGAADGPVICLDRRRALDPRLLWRLAVRVRELRPDVIHAWGLAALRAVRLAAPRATVVVRRPTGRWSALDRWLLRGAERVLAASAAEAARCRTVGVQRVCVVPPGIATGAPPAVEGRDIVCLGALRPEKGYLDALWAFDILRFVDTSVRLVIAGDGPQRRRLERFAAGLDHGGRVVFVRDSAVADLLASAAVVWVPSLADTGTGVALEAMAAGRPVVASRWLAEWVADGETGFVVDPGDKVGLARQTRVLLEDAALRRRLGEAGRRRAAELGVDRFVAAWKRALAA
jgi:glycosyltransferase involved in cell wall biosynthesis